MAGASLTSYPAAGVDERSLGRATADAEGRFEVTAAEQGMTRIFVTGPGCPLTSFDLAPTAEEVTLSCPDVPASHGSGRLLLPALAPGRYDLYLADATSPELIGAGLSQGFLSSASLAPLSMTELEVALDESP